MKLNAPCIFVALSCLLTGCASHRSASPYATPSAESRDPRKADELNVKAAELIEKRPKEAEQLLREALAADLYHGPAHNNLGVVYLNQGRLYEAANEFEWARRLLPGHPDPRMNLGFVYEQAGRTGEAIAAYRSALEVFPGYLESMEALVSLQIRTATVDDQTGRLLEEIAMRGETAAWREWAKLQRTKY